MNILFTSIGRRVTIIKFFKEELIKRNHGRLIAVDANKFAPALYFADKYYLVPKLDSKEYIPKLIEICVNEKIDYILPSIDAELFDLAKNSEKFINKGSFPLVSSYESIKICKDKIKMFKFLKKVGISTPITYLPNKISDIRLPFFIKPREGDSSFGANLIRTENELEFYLKKIKRPIFQEYVEGREFTIDCIADFEGNAIHIVPRERLKVIAGECYIARLIKNMDMIDIAKKIIEKLKLIGPLNIQCILTEDNEIKVTDINPRIGGGTALTYAAGVNMAGLLIDIMLNKKVEPQIGKFKEVIVSKYPVEVVIRDKL